jgi:site-specific recombinase XerD
VDTRDHSPEEFLLQEISDAVPRFLEHCRVVRHLSPNTLRAYSTDLADFMRHFKSPTAVASTATQFIQEYVRSKFDEEQLCPSTVKRRIATLKLLFRWLQREGVVPENPFHRLDLSIRIPRRLPRALSASEMRRLLGHAKNSLESADYDTLLDHLVVVILFATGLRVGELVSTSLVDVSLDDGTIRVKGKGSRERCVYLTGHSALGLLAQYMTARHSVQTTLSQFLVKQDGAALNCSQVRIRLKLLAQRSGITPSGDAAHASPYRRHATSRSRCRHSRCSATSGPRQHRNHRDLHARQ